jgi:hypothetical protein
MARRPTAADGTKLERRKETRFPVTVPVEASWRGADGALMKEEAVARQVNAHGGLLEMGIYPEIGTRVMLTNFLSAEAIEARVLATPSSREGVSQGIVIELVSPSETFWGVNLQMKKAGVELQRREKGLRSQGIDLRLLKEFRDAVDYMQAIAGSVQQARDRQTTSDEDGVDSWLVGERIRRTMNLCLEVITDFEAGRITEDTKGVGELQELLDQASQRLRTLLPPKVSGHVARNVELASPETSSIGRRRPQSRES